MDKKNSLTYFFKGVAQSHLKDYLGAINNFSEVVKLGENSYSALYRRGQAKSKINKFKSAIQDFSDAILINPDRWNAYSERGSASLKLKWLLKISENPNLVKIKKEMDINENFYSHIVPLGRCSLQIKYSNEEKLSYNSIINDFNIAIEINSDSSYVHIERGIAKIIMGDYQDAINDFTIAIESIPTETAYYYRGLARVELKDTQNALEDFNSALKINPKNYCVLSNKSELEISQFIAKNNFF